MAQRQFDLVLGGHDSDVTSVSGSSIGGSGVRVIIDDTNCKKKEDALQLLNYIATRIRDGVWPPA